MHEAAGPSAASVEFVADPLDAGAIDAERRSTCPTSRRLSTWVAGGMTHAEHARVLHHLVHCGVCRGELVHQLPEVQHWDLMVSRQFSTVGVSWMAARECSGWR